MCLGAHISRGNIYHCNTVSGIAFLNFESTVVEAYTCMILTVIEGFIVGLFFIQAPQEWMKANTKAFLNYTMFDTENDLIGISFCSGSLHQMLFFRDILFSAGPHDNIPPRHSTYFMLVLLLLPSC